MLIASNLRPLVECSRERGLEGVANLIAASRGILAQEESHRRRDRRLVAGERAQYSVCDALDRAGNHRRNPSLIPACQQSRNYSEPSSQTRSVRCYSREPESMLDELSQAVLAREEVVKYLRGGYGEDETRARERVYAYLDELRTTQRYEFYRALQLPLSPILRKIGRKPEHEHHAVAATNSHRVVYASNHKSHIDYLVEPIVLDDAGVRPPLIAAGINLFGGPLGLIHRHVTGAIPIRRNTKDPAYLITLKAYVAEILKKHDLFFYPEGGRSYSGEIKPAKTGLFNAALGSDRPNLVIIPVAVAYDLVLEDHILAHQHLKRRQRPVPREVAEMVRYAVGFRSRAFVTFGAPISVAGVDVHSRTEV